MFYLTGKYFAAILELDNPEKFTGHWVRRTSLSIGGDRGMSAPQLMGLGGHKSIQSVMKYIDRAPSTLRKQGDTMAIGGIKRKVSEEVTSSSSSIGASSSSSSSSSSSNAESSSASGGYDVVKRSKQEGGVINHFHITCGHVQL